MLDILSKKHFEILYKIMIRHDFMVDYKEVRLILYQIFSYLSGWGS